MKASFGYNGLGQRIVKTDETSGTGRHFLYGSNGELLVETDLQGNVLTEYLYLNGNLLAVYIPDHDQDGIPNTQEAEQGTLPVNTDSDGDGLPNTAEWFEHGTDSANPDSDGDGVTDGVEIAAGISPIDAGTFPGDGDINENGETNLGDLVLLYQFVTGTRIPTTEQAAHADMNRDGQLNAADILLLQKQLLQVWLGVGAPSSGAIAVRQIQWPYRLQTKPVFLDWLITPAHAVPANSGLLMYVHNDPLGTPQVMTDESGALVWAAQYDPFGKAAVNEDPDGDGSLVTLNVRFPGQYYDQETGLHYNFFRYYDPSTGRYLTSDPIGLVGGMNTYVYAAANPERHTDMFGLDLDDTSPNPIKPKPPVPGWGDVFCIGVNAWCSLNDQQEELEKERHRKNLELINDSCRTKNDQCENDPRPAPVCVPEAQRDCFSHQTEEFQRHSRALRSIRENYPINLDIQELCDLIP